MRTILLSSAALAVLLTAVPADAQTASGSNKVATPLTVPDNVRRVGAKDWPDAKPGTEIKPETKTTSTVKTDPLSLDGSATAKKDKNETAPATVQPASDPLAAAPNTPAPGKFEASKTGTAKPETSGAAAAPDSTAVKSQPATQTAAEGAKVEPDGTASIRLGTDASGHVAINAEQERQIGAAMRKQNAQPAAETNFDVKVGTAVPGSVRLGAVSRDVVEVLPQFRGYSYFATKDEIVMVEPSTKKIVALLPVRVTAAAARPGATKSRAASTSLPPDHGKAGERHSPETQQATTRRAPEVVERDVTVGAGPGPDRIVIERYDPRASSRGYRTLDPSDHSQVIIRRVPRGQIYDEDDDD